MRRLILPLVDKVLLVSFLVLTLVSLALARGREKTLYTFPGGIRGDDPQAGVVSDSEGNLYGTTYYGGAYGWGTVFELKRLTAGWTQRVLYSFLGSDDGFYPTGNLLLDKSGNLYGTTQSGGTGTCSGETCNGTIFELTRSGGVWKHSVLYSFCSASNCSDGAAPSGLTFDKAGNLYGTTAGGGAGCEPEGCGTLYKLTRSNLGWTEKVLYYFDENNNVGFFPASQVTLDYAGNIYGTTYVGGTNDSGNVFELKRTNNRWKAVVLYNFTSDEGGANGGLTLDGADVIFGTTQYGNGTGSVFELQRSDDKWKEDILYSGNGPNSHLILDKTGALYGTSPFGGAYGAGYVFRLRHLKYWQVDVLHSFTGGSDGTNPEAGLIFGTDGNLYGTTSSASESQYAGTVFQVVP